MRRSVTTTSKALNRSAMVARAEGSSSTRRMAAMYSRSGQGQEDRGHWALALRDRQEDREARPPAGRRFHFDLPAVGGHDATGERQAETRAGWFPRVEGVESAAALLGGHPAACIADGNRHR